MSKKLLLSILIFTFAMSAVANMADDDEDAMDDLNSMNTTLKGSDDMDMPSEKSDDMASEDAAAEGEVSEEEAPVDDSDGDEMSKKSVKNFTCKVTGAILSMAESIKELNNDIKAIKNQMFEKCPGFNASKTDSVDLEDSVDALNATDDKTNLEENAQDGVDKDKGEEEEVLPPIPTECDAPFQPVANSCYYFLYYPPDWKTWGDANAYCQTFGGTLAAPYRYDDLRKYLKENFSNVFWVGAKKSTTKKDVYEWLTGKELAEGDWKEGHPSKSAARFCVYLESFSGYKAINHYCGEKFSFVCEKRVETE